MKMDPRFDYKQGYATKVVCLFFFFFFLNPIKTLNFVEYTAFYERLIKIFC